MPTVTVALDERSYPIIIEAGALVRVGDLARSHAAPSRALVVSNPSIAARYAAMVQTSFQAAGIAASLAVVPPGDRAKSLRMASRLIDRAVDERLDRASAIVALGGGVVGDLAGFTAAIYLRGVSFIQIPTSLLAQVDASVGGKTAVNHPSGKNLVGSFHQPRLVVVDPAVLATLPVRELRSGLAEMIKHGVILDAAYFAELEAVLPHLLQRDPAVLGEAIAGSCRLKAAIVAVDERESGLRALLNYGHTFGHALEAVTQYRRYRHGEAVSVGMEMAAELAQEVGMLAPAERERQRALLRAAGLPTRLRRPLTFGAKELLGAMEYDKKAQSGRLRFVLPWRIGAGKLVSDVPAAAVRAVCERFVANAEERC